MTPEFQAAFEGVGAPSIMCACGRLNYARDGVHSGGPLIASTDIEHFGEGVLAKVVGGNLYVVGCKCDFFARFEPLLWHDRHRIARYLRERSQHEAAEALGTATALDKALSPEEYARHNPEQPHLPSGSAYVDCGEGRPGKRVCGRPTCRYCATNVFE